MLVSRIPSRGGWTEYHRNTVAKFYVPDPTSFSDEQQRALADAFTDIQDVEFPSIAEQLVLNTSETELSNEAEQRLSDAFPDLSNKLGEGFIPRRRVDRAVLEALNIPEDRHNRILELLYPALLNEIVHLKLIMG